MKISKKRQCYEDIYYKCSETEDVSLPTDKCGIPKYTLVSMPDDELFNLIEPYISKYGPEIDGCKDVVQHNKLSVHPQQLYGNWDNGWALDIYTTKSTPRPGGEGFDNEYTDVGYALHRLKYWVDISSDERSQLINKLSNAVVDFMQKRSSVTPCLDVIMPTPPSKNREIQLVPEMAKKIGQLLKISVDNEYLIKVRETQQLKGVNSLIEKREILDSAFGISGDKYQAKSLLLFDDVYDSGSTLNEITKTLRSAGKVQKVYVVTLTKTRK